jgi:hypothetical protein
MSASPLELAEVFSSAAKRLRVRIDAVQLAHDVILVSSGMRTAALLCEGILCDTQLAALVANLAHLAVISTGPGQACFLVHTALLRQRLARLSSGASSVRFVSSLGQPRVCVSISIWREL